MSKLKCQHCNKELIEQQRKWCGRTCKDLASYEKKKKRKELLRVKAPVPMEDRVCVMCGQQFSPKTKAHICCSAVCSERRRLQKLYEYNDKRARSKAPKIEGKCQDCGTAIKTFKSAATKRCQSCKDLIRANRAKEKRGMQRLDVSQKLGLGIEEYKEIKPKKLISHDEEIQNAINAYLKKGGKVKVAKPQKEPDSLYQALEEELEGYISSDLI